MCLRLIYRVQAGIILFPKKSGNTKAFSAVSAKNNLYISSGHENASCCGLYSTTGGILIYNHWVLVIIISGIVFSVPNQQYMKNISDFIYISAVAETHTVVCYHYLIVTR